MTKIKGNPAVIIAAHPTKNASDDNLIPTGSGAVLNDVDGNFTMSKSHKLHWQGKIRGPEFIPVPFKIELVKAEILIDTKGRQIPAPVMLPGASRSTADMDDAVVVGDTGRRLMRAMLSNPDGTQADWAKALNMAKSSINECLVRLKAGKLVTHISGKWKVGQKGWAAVKNSPDDAEQFGEEFGSFGAERARRTNRTERQ